MTRDDRCTKDKEFRLDIRKTDSVKETPDEDSDSSANVNASLGKQGKSQTALATQGSTELNQIIPPEIKNDRFYNTICRLAKTEKIKTVLEIGSSAGNGSTEAFVKGLKNNPHKPTLFCMEISKPRFAELQHRYRNDAFVKCYNVSSVTLDKFPTKQEISDFYKTTKTALNSYPLDQILAWHQQDIQYLELAKQSVDGIQLIKRENSIQKFDMVLIDGSEFTGKPELDQIYGAKIILLDDINAFKNYHNYKKLCQDPNYSLIEENHSLRNGYAVFKHIAESLPIHFFTIVLNGQPFIRHHIEVFKQLPIEWHWHIVEGVADLKNDTAWSLQYGGRICDEIHFNGLSNDGTTDYIDQIADQFPDQVTIYRKQNGAFWNGKLEMVNAPLRSIDENCILWQIDADELWTREQILKLHVMFSQNQCKTAAFFHCHFFVGLDLVTITPEAYSHHNAYEWLRAWRFAPGMRWSSHEPPRLMELYKGAWRDVAHVNPFIHDETAANQLVFTHYAYALESQLEFKESYYGYSNAVNQWKRLQQSENFPVNLKDYFHWVNDHCQVDRVDRRFFGRQVEPVPFDFEPSFEAHQPKKHNQDPIVIDGVIFQLQAGRPLGISRVWQNLIPEIKKKFTDRPIILLRRGPHTSQIRGITECEVPIYRFGTDDVLNADDAMLSEICQTLNAAVFLSTYYTRAPGFTNILLLHDFIPEVLGFDLTQPEWRAKSRAIEMADKYLSVSDFTKNDLLRVYPNTPSEKVFVTPNGVSNEFFPAPREAIDSFCRKHDLQHPYVILVGNRRGYKNCQALFDALRNIDSERPVQIAAIGGEPVLDRQESAIAENLNINIIPWLSDADLRSAYSGALALVFLSRYEGFGLPVIEALACGCPVITTHLSAIPEVAGPAAVYVDPDDPAEILNAISTVTNPAVREKMSKTGIAHAGRFEWSNTAGIAAKVINNAIASIPKRRSLTEQDQRELPRSQFKNEKPMGKEIYEATQKLLSQVDPDSAIEYLHKLIEYYPAFSLAHNDLGVLYYNSGKKEKVMECYRKALEIEPDNTTYMKNLADFLCIEKGQIEEAMQLYISVLAKQPDDTEALLALGRICEGLGKLKDAKDFYEKVISTAPNHAFAKDRVLKLISHEQKTNGRLNQNATTAREAVSQPENYLISAIVSTYNSERFIRGCLEDLESQTIADQLEIIVVDSCSTQNEEAIIKEFQKKYKNIKYIKTDTRETVYAAWNRAIKAATGKYITNANTDDRHRKDAFEVMANTLEKNPDISLAYADVIITEKENQTFETCTPVGVYRWLDWNREDLLNKGCFMGPQPMWRKTIHDEYGYFDESLVTSGDYEFWLRISQTHTFLHIPEFLGLYLKSPASIEHSNRDRQKYENQKILQMYQHAHMAGEVIGRVPDAKKAECDNPAGASNDETLRPRTDARISIIISNLNNKKRLHACVDRIQLYTPETHEIIFVNTNSTKAVQKWIKAITAENSKYRMIRCRRGAGRAECFNAGIRAAKGRYLLLISSDTLASEAWLTGLLECINASPTTAVVGPMTNRADGIQHVAFSEGKLSKNQQQFAMAFKLKNRHRRISTRLIDDFCVLIKRELFDQIGFFDENFTTKDFSIKDYCVRAIAAGYKIKIAGDVFVYRHPGSKPAPKHGAGSTKTTIEFRKFKQKKEAIKAESRMLQIEEILEKADMHCNSGRIDQAVDTLLEGIGKLPDNLHLYFRLAEILIAAGRYQDAKETLQEMPPTGTMEKPVYAAEGSSIDDESWIRKNELLGACEEGLNNHQKAGEHINRVLSRNPASIKALNLKGILVYKRGHKKQSEALFRKAISIDPGSGEAYTNLGSVLWDCGNKEDAIRLFEKGFILCPADTDVASAYHSAVTANGEFESAQTTVQHAGKLYPLNRQIRHMLIDILIQQGRYKQAMDEIELSLTLFGIEDGALAAALKIREKIGFMRSAKAAQKHGTVSVCLIVKNEEEHLARCLASVKPIVNEMIVIDTGSTDRTRDIALAFGAKVFDFEWRNDFSAARNYSISKASGSWILIIDADEVISSRDYETFRKIVYKPPSKPIAYSIVTRNYCHLANTIGWEPNVGEYPDEEAGLGWLPSAKVRLFLGKKRVRFEGAVHEMVDPDLKRKGIKIVACPIPVHHYGRLDSEKLNRKGQIYYEIGYRKLAESDGNTAALRELATQATILEKNEEAISLWEKFLAMSPPCEAAAEAYVNLGTVYNRMGQYRKALETAKLARELTPEKKEPRYNYAMAQLHLGNASRAVAALEELVGDHPDYPPARFVLVTAYCCTGKKAKAAEEINYLKNTAMGQALVYAYLEMSRELMAAGQHTYAINLLESAIENEIINKELLALYAKVLNSSQENTNFLDKSATDAADNVAAAAFRSG